MVGIAPGALVEAPPRTPVPYGLFSTFSFRPAAADRWESGVQFEVGTKGPVGGIGQWQVPPTATIGLPKTITKNVPQGASPGLAPGQAEPFTVYGFFSCSPMAWSPEEAQAFATDHLIGGEESRVEQAFWTGDLGNDPKLLQGGSVATPAGASAVDLYVGLGSLESWLATNYGGQGVIHMSRVAATAAVGKMVIQPKNGRLETSLGTPVAAGTGYPGTSPAGASPAAGTSWIYITPPIFGYRSEVFDSSARAGDLLDRANNDLYAVAERSYLLGFDPAGVAAALVNLPAV